MIVDAGVGFEEVRRNMTAKAWQLDPMIEVKARVRSIGRTIGLRYTTSFRMLAGLEEITEGTITIDGVVVNNLPPKARGIGMVFQSYALYPHMSVQKNLSFGLRMQKGEGRLGKTEIDNRVSEAADLLGLTEYLDRLPKNLSGGQRQRVALGRDLSAAKRLVDGRAPSNLTRNSGIKCESSYAGSTRLGTTTIYVTHDQVEAMTLADRLVIMNEGRAQQYQHHSGLSHPRTPRGLLPGDFR